MEVQPVSIDSVVHASGDVTLTSPTSPQIAPMEGGIPIEGPVKMKGRKRFMMGLKRMSSASSLGRMRSPSSPGYRSGGKGSMSCISLSSAGSPYDCSYGSSYSSELSAGYSTAPTSGSGTPNPEGQLYRVRTLGLDTPITAPLPSELRPSSPLGLTATNISETEEDYFSTTRKAKKTARRNFNLWNDLPAEIRMSALRYLSPKEIVRCSSVSKTWHAMCFDGQLWSLLDTSDFYRDIPATALVNIINSAGPFVRDLNLRGCVQLKEQWGTNNFADACRNLENFSLEGTEIPRMAIHTFLLQNSGLVHVNLSGLPGATNNAMKIIAQYCPRVEYLNISWCKNIDTRGVLKVVEACPRLRDLRAGEVLGWENTALTEELYKRNTLERLVLMHSDISDESLETLLVGTEPDIDFLTGRPNVPPRKLKHLDLTRCRNLTDTGIKSLAHNIPGLEGLQISKCSGLSDAPLLELFPTLPKLTHLDLEELEDLTNECITCLASSPCAPWLKHLSISYCENLGDAGMLPLVKNAVRLESLDMDNTRVSDLVLIECAANLRDRNRVARGIAAGSRERPSVGMRVVAYDCANVTWTSIREVLSRNAEYTLPPPPAKSAGLPPSGTQTPMGETEGKSAQLQQQQPQSHLRAALSRAKGTYPAQILALKCFYNYQPTVDEHTKRVMKGDFPAALRLERKWAEWMMLNEEAGAGGAGGRRRRRRAREAMMMHADEEDGAGFGAGAGTGQGRRRRARSGGSGCVVM